PSPARPASSSAPTEPCTSPSTGRRRPTARSGGSSPEVLRCEVGRRRLTSQPPFRKAARPGRGASSLRRGTAECLGRAAHDLVVRYVLNVLRQAPPVPERLDDLSL